MNTYLTQAFLSLALFFKNFQSLLFLAVTAKHTIRPASSIDY